MFTTIAMTLCLGLAQAAPAGRVPAPSEIGTLARGWAALAGGRTAEAERIADGVLASDPSSHHAIALKLEAQAAAPLNALDTYERWLGAQQGDDLGLLAIVADGTLRELARGGDTSVRAEAQRQLASGQSRSPVSAAELQRLQRAAQDEGVTDKTAIAEALARAGGPALPVLIDLTNASRGPSRAAAARALGSIGDARAETALLSAFADDDPFVRAAAAIALARIGNSTGQSYVTTMLASDIADLRLMAAEAWDGRPGPWVEAVRPLLDDGNTLVKVRAATALAPVDPEQARRAFATALGDPNPAVRGRTARALIQVASEHPDASDPASLRRLLRDADPWIRLSAAAALRSLARARHQPSSSGRG